jgi:tRNA(Ile)-lysidine synthase
MAADRDLPVSPAQAAALFQDLQNLPAVVLAVSGGPDSTALMMLAARWRSSLARGPKLIAVTVDHGLRKESAGEARAVAKLARKLGVTHRIVRWTGRKPSTGLQEAARTARYTLLAKAAQRASAPAIVTAHTLDDQAETVLFRLARGSGLSGLSGIRRESRVPGADALRLVRPLLSISKSRLIATLKAAKIAFAEDPTNRDPRFTRPRLRALMPKLAEEGLDAKRLALLATRIARAEHELRQTADMAYELLGKRQNGRTSFDAAEALGALSDEIALRLLGRAIADLGDEGPVELGKLEALHAALMDAFRARTPLRRTLAGAVITLDRASLAVERAPPRRSRGLTNGLTRGRSGRKKR